MPGHISYHVGHMLILLQCCIDFFSVVGLCQNQGKHLRDINKIDGSMQLQLDVQPVTKFRTIMVIKWFRYTSDKNNPSFKDLK